MQPTNATADPDTVRQLVELLKTADGLQALGAAAAIVSDLRMGEYADLEDEGEPAEVIRPYRKVACELDDIKSSCSEAVAWLVDC
jgi:hypothetical protein